MHGLGMGQVWVGYGSGMGRVWVGYGSGMGQVWVRHGSSMGRVWVEYGSSMGHIHKRGERGVKEWRVTGRGEEGGMRVKEGGE